MKIWVTGATGSLGSEILNEAKISFPNSEIFFKNSKELDLLNPSAVIEYVEKVKPTHVVHLAAKVFGIGGHKENPNLCYSINSRIDANLFQALNLYPPEWIFYSSTVAAYGYPYTNLPLKEEHLLNGKPHSSELGYSLAKREALKLLEQIYKKHYTNFTYGCLTNLYGSEDRNIDGKGHVIVSLIERARLAAKNDQKLKVWGTRKASRDFLNTKDAARIIFELLGTNTGVINIATGQEIHIEYIAQVLCESLELKKGYEFTGKMEGLLNRVCSIEKLKTYSKHVQQLDATDRLRLHLLQSTKNNLGSVS